MNNYESDSSYTRYAAQQMEETPAEEVADKLSVKPTSPSTSPLMIFIKSLIALISLSVIIATDFAYEDALYEYSLETVIPDIQSSMPSDSAQQGWRIFSDASLALLPATPIVLLFIVLD